SELGIGHPLEYAIYWSPIAFIATLIRAGSNPNYPDDAGFPSIHAALSTDRPDKNELIKLLLEKGADPNQRGLNDWTPLHHAVARRDVQSIKLLVRGGADPELRTRIDDCETALEAAELVGLLREFKALI